MCRQVLWKIWEQQAVVTCMKEEIHRKKRKKTIITEIGYGKIIECDCECVEKKKISHA